MRRELSALKLFCDGADLQGLMTPGFGSQELVRTAIADGFSWLDSKPNSLNDTFIWPKDGLLPALALAQHNGVRTRLLDWTSAPLVAAYFALAEALRLDRRPEHSAIWICDSRVLLGDPQCGPPALLARAGVYVYKCASFGNANLAAQQGYFVFPRFAVDPNDDFEVGIGIEEIVSRGSSASDPGAEALPIRKLLFPVTQAQVALRKLRELGVHGSSIFPGFRGCFHYAEEAARDLPAVEFRVLREGTAPRSGRTEQAVKNWENLPVPGN